MDRSLGTGESTIPTSKDMAPPLPVPLPEPIVVRRQVATRGRGTRSHPYFIGDHFGYARQVLEGAGCHRRDRGHRIVASRFPNGHPSDAGDSNTSGLQGEGAIQEWYGHSPLWEELVLMNQYKFSVPICSFSVLSVLRCFSA